MQSLFHLAFHVRDLEQAKSFYCGMLQCEEGRSTDTWLDVSLYGHQLSLHLGEPFAVTNTGRVGEHWVPMPHMGVILQMADWKALADRLTKLGMQFVIEPTVRFAGEPGEQATMFFVDPFGNPIEVKGFADWASVYAT